MTSELSANSGIVEVRFLGPEGKGRASKVEKDLKSFLADWQKIVAVTFEPAT
jgi:hypothetical protein